MRGPSNISPDERPVLDMRFAYNIIQLCSSCTFTLSDLVITNDRKGSGPQYDLFQGEMQYAGSQDSSCTRAESNCGGMLVRSALLGQLSDHSLVFCRPHCSSVLYIRLMRHTPTNSDAWCCPRISHQCAYALFCFALPCRQAWQPVALHQHLPAAACLHASRHAAEGLPEPRAQQATAKQNSSTGLKDHRYCVQGMSSVRPSLHGMLLYTKSKQQHRNSVHISAVVLKT